MDRALGKKAGVVQDPRTVRLAQILSTDLPPIPKTWRIAKGFHGWPLYRNDRIGDCGLASQGHGIIAHEKSSGQREPLGPPSEAQIVKAYSDVSGYDPRTGANDNGVYLLDVLRYMRRTGIGREADGSSHQVGAYAKVRLAELLQVKRGAHLFGGLYTGVALPSSAADEIDRGEVWTATDDELYSWGGHAMWMIGYDAAGVTFATWGAEQRATWDWFRKYVDEGWAVISEDFLRKSGTTPQGLDVAKLQQLLGAIS